MRVRTLGESGPAVPEVGFGCMGLSSSYTETDDDAAIETIHRAIELGVTHFDTADAYGGGHNETLVGRALADRRDQVTIATKFGQLTRDGQQIVCGTPEYVRSACEASLERLGIDTIDLYYAHRVDPEVPIEETVGAMGELVSEGKVRLLGLSEAAPETLRRANAAHPLAALQAEYSLWTRFAEGEHFPLCEELGLAYVAYSPLGRGFLSASIKSSEDMRDGDRRHAHPRFSADNLSANVPQLDVLQTVAVEVGAAPAQVALAWVLAQKPFLHTIPGTTSVDHLEQNVAATEIELADEQVARLSASFAEVAGDRYPAGALKKVQL